MRICTYENCSSPLDDDAHFCPRCGRIATVPAGTVQLRRWLLVIGLFVVFGLAIGLVVVAINSEHAPSFTPTPTSFDGPVVVLGPVISQHFRVTGTNFRPSLDGSGVQGIVTLQLEPLPNAPAHWPHRLIRIGDPNDAGRSVACELPPADLSGTVNVTCVVLSAGQRRRLDVEYVRADDSGSH